MLDRRPRSFQLRGAQRPRPPDQAHDQTGWALAGSGLANGAGIRRQRPARHCREKRPRQRGLAGQPAQHGGRIVAGHAIDARIGQRQHRLSPAACRICRCAGQGALVGYAHCRIERTGSGVGDWQRFAQRSPSVCPAYPSGSAARCAGVRVGRRCARLGHAAACGAAKRRARLDAGLGRHCRGRGG